MNTDQTVMTLTPETVAAALTDDVAAVLAAQAYAEVVRHEVDALKQHVLDAAEYTCQYTGERITEPRKDWQMLDEQSQGYYAKVAALVAEAGYDVPQDYCPALMAESDLVDAENALLTAAAPMFDLTPEVLKRQTPAKRREFLELLCKLTVTAAEMAA